VAYGVVRSDLLLVAVLDGHGPHGHFISRHVRDRLPAWVAASAADSGAVQTGIPAWVTRAGGTFQLDDATGALTRCASAHGGRSGGGDKGVPPPSWAAALSRAYIALDEDLCACRSTLLAASKVTPDTSGCCVVTALVGAGHLVVASCGDSSAFLAIAPPPGAVTPDGCARAPYGVRAFSLPHKPSGEEAKRIKQAGGRIGTMPREEHILRVWPKPPDNSRGSAGSGSLGTPGSADFGLAVSRAFGDMHWKSAGVCATPDIAYKPLAPNDAFLVLCTDGVTDVMSPEEVVAVAGDALHGGRNAGEAVLEAAKRAWATTWPRHARDDITVAVVALQPSLWAGGGEG
jgi:serine/threonine protein phosphatase PrpC